MHKTIKGLAASLLAAALLAVPVAADTAPQEGIDVSRHYDEAVDFARVKASGRSFAYLKATEGSDWNDSYFTANRQGAAAAGIAWGPYHFFRAYSVDSARRQAEHFWAVIRGTGYTLRPVVDVETADGQQRAVDVRAILQAFCDRFRALSGEDPVIYSYTSYIREYGLAGQFGGYTLWQADYRATRGDTGWDAAVWQYSEDGSVPGVTAPSVDLNRLYDTAAYVSGSSPAPAAVVPIFCGDPTVWTIQCQLNDTAISRPRLVEDGISGPATKAQIRVLEQVAGLNVDAGVWGPQCVNAIETIYSRPVLKRGSRGLAVRYLQYRLGLPIDGIFGARTEAAVRARQAAAGIAVDGIVGPATYAALGR